MLCIIQVTREKQLHEDNCIKGQGWDEKDNIQAPSVCLSKKEKRLHVDSEPTSKTLQNMFMRKRSDDNAGSSENLQEVSKPDAAQSSCRVPRLDCIETLRATCCAAWTSCGAFVVSCHNVIEGASIRVQSWIDEANGWFPPM